MKIYNFPQYSDEWWEIRKKKMTASHATAIATNGAGLKTYIQEIMVSLYSKEVEVSYSSKSMARGLELEDSAATVYSFENNIEVRKIGFVVYSEYVGCSPDIYAGDGMAEIKCPEDKTYFKYLLDRKIDTKYYAQMQMQMLCCGRPWCDYVVYNPNFDQDLIVQRVFPDDDKFKKLHIGFKAGEKMIKTIEAKLRITTEQTNLTRPSISLHSTPEWKAWEGLIINEPEVTSKMMPPVDVDQCVLAVKQANRIIDKATPK